MYINIFNLLRKILFEQLLCHGSSSPEREENKSEGKIEITHLHLILVSGSIQNYRQGMFTFECGRFMMNMFIFQRIASEMNLQAHAVEREYCHINISHLVRCSEM